MKNLCILLFALVSFTLSAQRYGEIQGKVFDENGNPMSFVNVIVYVGDRPMGSTTDENGKYRIKPLQPGSYNMEFSFIGYHKHSIPGVVVDPDKIKFVQDVTLLLNSVVITGEAVVEASIDDLIDPEDCHIMTIRSAQFEKSPVAKDPIRLIASMSSEITKKEDSDELYFRGSRGNAVLYLIDGIKVTRGIGRFPGGAMASVSIYTGGLPAKYGDTTGGVVAVETKTYFDFYNQKIAELSAIENMTKQQIEIQE